MIIIGAVLAVVLFKNKPAVVPENGSVSKLPVFCTQDAKQCPDGSYVSRQGPNCEFAPCLTRTPIVSQLVNPTSSIKTSPTPTTTPRANTTPHSQTVIITLANGIATPNIVNIKVSDTIKFINNDSALHWPASGVHPTHQICPGFDALDGLNTSDSYSFIFREAKTCPWHDHLQPSLNGKIEVAL